MTETSTSKTKTKEPIRAVLYSDGSAKPTNPGKIGWSVHGYTLHAETSIKGAGHPKVVPTMIGYVDKGPAAVCADVVHYYDYLGWSPVVTTNNAAEILGCAQAFKYASSLPTLKHLNVYSDSKYVVNGVGGHIHQWVGNNWNKRDGTPVQNQAEWKELLQWMDQLRANGTKVKVEWVKGHGTDFGNIKADHLASIGSEIALTADSKGGNERISKSEGYWKSDLERNPLLGLRGWFFTVNPAAVVRGEYFLCNQVKSDEFIGSRSVDGSFGYVKLAEPDELLELVRERQLELAREFDTLALARIDRIYDKAVCAAIDTYGKIVLRKRRKHANDLHFINEDAMVRPSKDDEGAEKAMPITEELYPPRLALRCVTTISRLKAIVDKFIEAKNETPKVDDCVIYDITSTYYDITTDKQGKATKMFKKTIHVANQSLMLRREAFGREMDFQQIFTIHMLARNNLKRLEGTDVQVWLVIERTSDHAVRYSSVVRSNNDWSAWSGAHSNLIVFKEKLQ